MLRNRAVLSGILLLADAVGEAAAPSEFRLFKAGENQTTKGVFLFDAAAAESVMAAAKEQGVDLMVDLEHQSIDPDAPNWDPDARAWLSLEVRNGELWAVNVRWTEDGARRLDKKTQRYISPAFKVDEDNRVTEIVNIALVAMPATHDTPALVAANRRPPNMSTKQIQILAARLSRAQEKIKKLADDGAASGEGDAAGKFATVQSTAKEAVDALSALEKVKDVDQAMDATATAMAAMDKCEAAIKALTGAQDADPTAPAPGAAPDAAATAQTAKDRAELVELRRQAAKRDEDEKVAKLAAEMKERADLCAELVTLGVETPDTVKVLAALPVEALRDRVAAFKKFDPKKLSRAIVPPSGGGGHVTAIPGIERSEFEEKRVLAYAERKAAEWKAAGLTPREPSQVLARYFGHREQQFRGAKSPERIKELGGRVEEQGVLLSVDGRLVTLTSTPVKPIEEFGPSSQRSLEEFRMNYNMALAAEPMTWAESLGDIVASGSINKDTFPINLSATRYTKKKAQAPGAETSLNFDISVTKDEFYAGEEVELRRLRDFAHVLSWGRRAERMARARVFLRNALVTTLLEAGTSGYWGSSSELATGIDGQAFFSASHKVHPRDASKKLRGVATWGNYQSTAKPLNAVNLTGQKPSAFLVADPTGHEFGFEFDTMLHPSSLNETAKNLLTVQDIIIEAGTVNGVSNAFAATKNPHYQSGMMQVRAPDLAGTDTTADWYLISRAAIASGLVPWLICEDGAEDLRTWDETSDLYKDDGIIKVTSHIYLAAVLMFPHGIRLVKGA